MMFSAHDTVSQPIYVYTSTCNTNKKRKQPTNGSCKIHDINIQTHVNGNDDFFFF